MIAHIWFVIERQWNDEQPRLRSLCQQKYYTQSNKLVYVIVRIFLTSIISQLFYLTSKTGIKAQSITRMHPHIKSIQTLSTPNLKCWQGLYSNHLCNLFSISITNFIVQLIHIPSEIRIHFVLQFAIAKSAY